MNSEKRQPDELIEFLDDDEQGPAQKQGWRVLIVDDDEDVHQSTRFVLANAEILGRPVTLLHARSAEEARQLLAGDDNIAVAFIDVVMETPDAGLQLVRHLREDGMHDMRIVLRTGQPGYAPELSVVSEYEIDDYRTKAELTRTRLLTVLTAAIRTYAHLRMIRRNRNGLEMIVESASELFRRPNLEMFSRGVLMQISNLLGIDTSGVVCVDTESDRPITQGRIVSSTGRFADYLGLHVAQLGDPELLDILEAASDSFTPIFRNHYMALCFSHDTGRRLAMLIEAAGEIVPEDLALLKLFSANIAIGFDNLSLVEHLDKLAYLDPVLEIPNLNAFEATLERWHGGTAGNMRLAMVTLDTFPTIAATYGVRIAHSLLGEAYRCLKNGDGKVDVARIGDGSFALFGPPDRLDEETIAAAFPKAYEIEGIEVAATATSVLIDITERSADTLSILRTANAAMTHAINTQPGQCVHFDETMKSEVERKISLRVGLKQVLETAEGLSAHLQPKIDLATDTVSGAEMLARWTYQGESISPAEFIPIAEAAGLTSQLTEFLVTTLGRWMRERQGKRPLCVAINLSMNDLNRPGFAARLLQWVDAAGLTPGHVSFEVTEGIAMKNQPWAVQQVGELKAAGYGVSLDDFGTGYCSLGYMSRLPIDTVKIDKSFVAPLNATTARNSLAAVVIGMTKALNIGCVAEGIETEEQKQALIALGCKTGQGFLLGRPVPIEDFDARFPV